jgi:hypothetical protein
LKCLVSHAHTQEIVWLQLIFLKPRRNNHRKNTTVLQRSRNLGF